MYAFPRKAAPCPLLPIRLGLAAVATRGCSGSSKGPRIQSSEQPATHQHGSQGQKRWGKKSVSLILDAGREEQAGGLGSVVSGHRCSTVSARRYLFPKHLRDRQTVFSFPKEEERRRIKPVS